MCKFEIFKGSDGFFYFRFKAANGEKVAQSEGYISKQGALNGIAVIKQNAATAPVVDLT